MTNQDIATLRLANQGIATTTPQTAVDIVGRMGAMQAQDYYGSLWAIGLRAHSTEKEILKAIDACQIVRTWPQRGTLHFVLAEDARWLVSLSAERMLRGAKRQREQLGIDEKLLEQSEVVITQALSSGLLTRPKLMELLEDAGISTKSGRGYYILWHLSQSGVTFIGPMEGKQQTVGLLNSLPVHHSYDREAGIAELAKRYFTSHGPATLADFIGWSGLTSKDAKAGLAANAHALTGRVVAGTEYWLPKTSVKPEGDATCYLLPGFDEYLLGYKDRSAVLHPDNFPKIVPSSNGIFLSTIVIDGQIVGTWKRTVKRDHVAVALTPFTSFSAADSAALQRSIEHYSSFLGLPVKIEG